MTIQWPLGKLRAIPREAEITAGVAAAAAKEGWMSGLIGEPNNVKMVTYVITVADGSKDQTPAGRQTAAVTGLTKIIKDAGYGSAVSAEMISGIVDAVLKAVAALRSNQEQKS